MTTVSPETRTAVMAAPTAATPRTAAVIPAAGQARRFGSGENKIWASLAGRAVLERTLSVFNAHPAIASIVVVANPEEIARVQAMAQPFAKVRAVVAGGATRAESVKNGLDALPPDTEVVLVHDAARPLVSASLLDHVIEAAERVGGAVPGFPLSDTVKRTGSDRLVRTTIARTVSMNGETLSGLTAVQTPQGARLGLLREAYAAFDFSRGEPTDEASLLEAIGVPVEIVPGEPTNIKITRPEDIALAERLIANSDDALSNPAPTPDRAESSLPVSSPSNTARFPEIRTGLGYDVHAFALPEAGRRLFLGGVEIPHDRGLEGHSDADVLLHAVCDALLGAVSLGDIGILFPNTDNAYKGIASLRLLAIVADRVRAEGWDIVNLDATVVAEAPKLLPHRDAILRTIGECLGLEAGRVSVKATTSEKMGFVGRREGVACWAVATVRRVS